MQHQHMVRTGFPPPTPSRPIFCPLHCPLHCTACLNAPVKVNSSCLHSPVLSKLWMVKTTRGRYSPSCGTGFWEVSGQAGRQAMLSNGAAVTQVLFATHQACQVNSSSLLALCVSSRCFT